MKYRLKKIAAVIMSTCVLCTSFSFNAFAATKLYDSVTREIREGERQMDRQAPDHP